MKFDEQKAKEIIEKYSLNDKTIRVWRSRNAIPDKYAREDYNKRITTKAGDIRHDHLMDLLKTGMLNRTVLSGLTNIPLYKINDAVAGKARLSDSDVQKCKIEIKRVKIEIAKTFERFHPLQLKRLFNNPLLVYTKIIGDKMIFSKVSYLRLKNNSEPDKLLWQQVKDKYIVFAMTLNI